MSSVPASLLHFSTGRTLLDWLCMPAGDASREEEVKELCQRMVIQGLLHPLSDSPAELQGGQTVSAVFNVRGLSSLSCLCYKNDDMTCTQAACSLKLK